MLSNGVPGSRSLPTDVPRRSPRAELESVPLRGDVVRLSLSVRAHAAGQVPRGSADTEGSAVSFCAQGARLATLEIDGQGSGLAWLLAVWQSGRSVLGVVAR